MQELWTATFADTYGTYSGKSRDKIDSVIDRLLVEHESASMRNSLRTIVGEQVWSTERIYLSNDVVRISWQYSPDTDAIILIIVASVETP